MPRRIVLVDSPPEVDLVDASLVCVRWLSELDEHAAPVTNTESNQKRECVFIVLLIL
jgi:hypothetical protein